MIINKILSLERCNSPALKQIPLPWDAIIAGGAQIINGVVGAGNTSSSNKTNLKIAQMNNDAMLQANRENNDWSRNTAIEMFNLQNEYNDPSAIKARLEAAGLNPSVVMGQNNPMVQGNIQTPQAQPVPSFQQAQVSPVPSPFVGLFDAIEKYSSAIHNISSAKQKDTEAKIALEKLQPEIDKIWSEVNLNNAQAAYQNCQKALSELKAPYEVKLMIANAALSAFKGQESQANAALLKAERQLTNSKNKQLKLQMPYIVQQARESINLMKAQKASAYANANLSNAQAKTEDVLRNFRVLESDADIKRIHEITRQAHLTGDSQVLENYLKFRGLDGKSAIEVAMRILGNKEKLDNEKEFEEYLRENGVVK